MSSPFKSKSTPSRQGYSFELNNVSNPILDQVLDSSDLSSFYKDRKLIPYSSGNMYTSHSLRLFLNKAKTISPTLGSVHNAIAFYLFSTKLIPTAIIDTSIEQAMKPEINEADLKSFLEFQTNFNYRGNLLRTIKYQYSDYFDSGDYWLEYSAVQVAGKWTFSIKPLPGVSVMLHEKEGVSYAAVTSGSWFSNNAKVLRDLPVFPNYAEDEKGIIRTVYHQIQGNYPFYGRPLFIAQVMNVYRQYQDLDNSCKAGDNLFTGQLIVEYEADDTENQTEGDDPTSVSKRIEDTFSPKAGKPKTLLVMERPVGATPVTVEQVKINTNEAYLKFEDEKNRRAIFEAFSWSERLLGNAVGTGFNMESYTDELKAKDTGILQYFRDELLEGINVLQKFSMELMNLTIPIKLAVKPIFAEEQKETSSVADRLAAYGVGVRAGGITPHVDDEAYFRNELNIPTINEDIISSWADDKNIRRPITLKGQDEINADTQLVKNKVENA